jgi:hypothetical protein
VYVRDVIVREDVPEVESPPESTPRWATMLGGVIIVAFGAVAVFGLIAIYPDDVVEPRDAAFLDNIFANEFVLFAARLVLFSAAAVAFFAAFFAILSVIQWIKNGQWLRRAGPFEVDPHAVSTLDDEVERWRGEAEETRDELHEMRQRLEETQALADEMYEKVIVLENENDELRHELQIRPPR